MYVLEVCRCIQNPARHIVAGHSLLVWPAIVRVYSFIILHLLISFLLFLILSTTNSWITMPKDSAGIPYPLWANTNIANSTNATNHINTIPTKIMVVHDLFENIHDKSGHQGFNRCIDGLKNFAVHKSAHLLKTYIKHCPHCHRSQTRRHLRSANYNGSSHSTSSVDSTSAESTGSANPREAPNPLTSPTIPSSK